MTKKTKILIAVGVPAIIVLALAIFLLVWFLGERYPAFDASARAEVQLEGLDEGFVPQGLCALPEGGYAVSGYMKDKSSSRVYFLGTGETKYITVRQGDKVLTSHFGGVAATKEYLYLTSGNKIVRVPLAQALASENKGAVAVADDFDAGFGLAFCQIWNGYLVVGEFYRPGNYETDASHHVTVGGETNPALVYCYELDEAAPGGGGALCCVLSVRGLVQGIAFTEENIYLSCSWGLADSEICVYANPIAGGASDAQYEVNGVSVPLYFFGGERQLACEKLPSMTEGIFAEGDRLYVLFESACQKYKSFVRRQMKFVTSVPLDMFK